LKKIGPSEDEVPAGKLRGKRQGLKQQGIADLTQVSTIDEVDIDDWLPN
jgi:hypothetical protein